MTALLRLKKMQTLNQSDFAKHIGVNKSYITQLKQEGRLVFSENGKVDVEASLIKIKETADPNRDDVSTRHAEKRTAIVELEVKPKKIAKQKSSSEVTFSEARAKEQHYKSLQAELEYQKAISEVVSVAEMKAAVGDVVTTFKQALENLPHRAASQFIGKDLEFIRATLKQEIVYALTEMEKNFDEKLKGQAA
jgi:transcriptional regulator with XRE-family HTH domain